MFENLSWGPAGSAFRDIATYLGFLMEGYCHEAALESVSVPEDNTSIVTHSFYSWYLSLSPINPSTLAALNPQTPEHHISPQPQLFNLYKPSA